MKHSYFILTSFLIFSAMNSIAQNGANFEKKYEPIRKELKDWDPVRGEWLANNLPAVINNQPVGVRNFPENMTPHQVLALVPKPTLDRMGNTIASNQSGREDAAFWNEMNTMITNVNCAPTRGRSYGDPHLTSYDGERFSFQTVGEFVLTKSDDAGMEVQTRQKAVQDDFSLNTAVAMNVSGDRVCLYAEDHPDGNRSTPVRLNGRAINISAKPYFLDNGGVITRSNNGYVIDWPTGESVVATPGRTGGISFYNVSVGVNTCTRSYSGVLGNANGIRRDDFDVRGSSAPITFFPSGNSTTRSRDIERQRLTFLAKDFADLHRITQATSLFDYGMGQSTFSFTDRSFPRFHRSIHDLNADQRALARTNCRNGGVLEADMEGCIYDNAYLNIPPVAEPPVREPVDPSTVVPVRNPVTNTNPEPPIRHPAVVPSRSPSSVGGTPSTPKGSPAPVKNTGVKNNNTPMPRPSTSQPTTRPSSTPTTKPTPTPRPTTRPSTPRPSTPRTAPKPTPRPVYKPTPRPPAPKPKPRPAPKPKPRPATPRSGRG